MTLQDNTDLLPRPAVHRARRREPGRPDGGRGPPPPARRCPARPSALSLDFRSQLPRVSRRTGYKGDFYLVAQWFPKVGVLQEAGWNCHQFHATSEFFSDFGNYDVSIDVPARYRGKVGATGGRSRSAPPPRETGSSTGSGRRASTTSRGRPTRLLVARDNFHEAGLHDVDLTLLLQPEHAGQAERHFKAGRARRDLRLRPRARGLPVRHADDRGSSLGRAGRRRDGVPDAHHRRHVLSLPGRRTQPRRRDDPRVRPPVLLRPPRLQRVRGAVPRRGLQHLHDRPRAGLGLRRQPSGPLDLRPAVPARHRPAAIPSTPTAATSPWPRATSTPPRAGSSATAGRTAPWSTRTRRWRWPRSSACSTRRRHGPRAASLRGPVALPASDAPATSSPPSTTRPGATGPGSSTAPSSPPAASTTPWRKRRASLPRPPRGLFEKDGKLAPKARRPSWRRRGATTAS